MVLLDGGHTHSTCVLRMIDWLSWPLAQHVDTWVIALLKGLAAVQKFTILIDVTLLKIELVGPEMCSCYVLMSFNEEHATGAGKTCQSCHPH